MCLFCSEKYLIPLVILYHSSSVLCLKNDSKTFNLICFKLCSMPEFNFAQ